MFSPSLHSIALPCISLTLLCLSLTLAFPQPPTSNALAPITHEPGIPVPSTPYKVDLSITSTPSTPKTPLNPFDLTATLGDFANDLDQHSSSEMYRKESINERGIEVVIEPVETGGGGGGGSGGGGSERVERRITYEEAGFVMSALQEYVRENPGDAAVARITVFWPRAGQRTVMMARGSIGAGDEGDGGEGAAVS